MANITLITQQGLLDKKADRFFYNGSVGDFIAERYKGKNIPFAVYENENDITFDVDLLLSGNDSYTVIETPAGQAALIISIVSIVLTVAAVLLTPKPKLPSNVNRNQESPNNRLTSRSNEARPLQRIPDIKGTVNAIPDIIMPTYTMFEGGVEVEHGYYCVGRKQLSIQDIKDSDTPIELISGASVGVYYPDNNPNLGAPDEQFGDAIERDIYVNYRLNDVNGIYLPPEQSVGATPIIFGNVPVYGYQMSISSSSDASYFNVVINKAGTTTDWLSPDYYKGNNIIFDNLIADDITSPYPSYTINNSLEILSDVTSTISPDIIGGSVINVRNYSFTVANDGSIPINVLFSVVSSGSITTEFSMTYNEWYYFTRDAVDRGIINVVAENGIYRDTGSGVYLPLTIDYEMDVEGVDEFGNPDGVSTTYSSTISGNNQSLRGSTIEFETSYQTRFRIRVRRTTARNTSSGNIVDAIKLKDVYALKDLGAIDFGSITTIQTKTIANQSATSVKERQLNCTAQEMLYVYEGSGVFSGTLTTNESAIQSFITDAIDPYIGNRDIAEIDADGLLDLEDEINTYFSSTLFTKFDYTLDSTDITFQEYAQMLFNAINCIVYRENNQIKALFEQPQTIPTMLFTHRSKIPNTETYSRNFNKSALNDGIELKYKDYITKTEETIYLPSDKSALNPKRIELVGVRNVVPATVRAKREYNKIKLMKQQLEFSSTIEGRFVKPNDMIAVVKGTRTRTFDGEVVSYNSGTGIVTLSQPVTFTPGDDHYITFKYTSGSVTPTLCVAGATDYEVDISPVISTGILTYDDDVNRRTEFTFWNESRAVSERWLAQEIDISDKWEVKIKAINYNDDYYQNDLESLDAFSSGFSSGFS